jgi:hypothetical protein
MIPPDEKHEKAMQARLSAVETLMDRCAPERNIFLALSVASYVLLFVCAASFFILAALGHKEFNITAFWPLFGSTGAVAFSTNRCVRFWDDALKVVFK